MSKLTNTLDAAEEALYDAVKLYDQYRYDRAYDEDFIAELSAIAKRVSALSDALANVEWEYII